MKNRNLGPFSGALYRWASAALVCLALTGCATGPNANPQDPLEPFNRGVTRFNDGRRTLSYTGVCRARGDKGAWTVADCRLQVALPSEAGPAVPRDAEAEGKGSVQHDFAAGAQRAQVVAAGAGASGVSTNGWPVLFTGASTAG